MKFSVEDQEDMKKHQGSFDFILNTIPVGHEMDPYLGLLKIDAQNGLLGSRTFKTISWRKYHYGT
jgi:D-arabinose 1-dehydrogenase-like Zn-dependent alcohol dehydrogenase